MNVLRLLFLVLMTSCTFSVTFGPDRHDISEPDIDTACGDAPCSEIDSGTEPTTVEDVEESDPCEGEDRDADGLSDSCDPCIFVPGTDLDGDGDGIGDDCDNCIDSENSDQIDSDQDGLGDACDAEMIITEDRGGCDTSSGRPSLVLVCAGLVLAASRRR